MITAVVPAAGIGKRMGADIPKQYLSLSDKCILQTTLDVLLQHPQIEKIIVPLHKEDHYFSQLSLADDPRVETVLGRGERADSVIAGLEVVQSKWVLVHDAARPFVQLDDIDALIKESFANDVGAILAMPVRDTMKRSNKDGKIIATVERENLWHALTPQMFQTQMLMQALLDAKQKNQLVTDEASAMEMAGYQPALVSSYPGNIKITHPQDLEIIVKN